MIHMKLAKTLQGPFKSQQRNGGERFLHSKRAEQTDRIKTRATIPWLSGVARVTTEACNGGCAIRHPQDEPEQG